MLTYLLLQDRSDVDVGGVGGQGEDRSRQGVSQGNGGDESLFGGGESSFHVWRPRKGGGERAELPGDPREETAVEIYHT